jgi:hypothetical protein
MPVLALKVAALAIAASGVVAGGQAELGGHPQTVSEVSVTKVIYIVRSGDTLGGIAGYFCHDPNKYHELAQANGIANPNVISVGEHIWLACGGTGGSSSSSSSASSSSSGSSYAAGSAVVPGTSSIYSYIGLERLWELAGGSSATAFHAACIAEHESSGKPWAISPTDDWGLWQIHNGGQSMLVPFQNAQRAIAMSGNGTDWSAWSTRDMC